MTKGEKEIAGLLDQHFGMPSKKKTKQLRLYDIPFKSKIYEKCSDGSSYFIFDHPDGMYSYCVTEKGGIVHLGMAAPLKKYKNGYKFNWD